MPPTVYIETTIPIAYVTTRRDPKSLARKADTREWWAKQRKHYDCAASE